MSNLGLRIAMREAGITMLETKVGDRYVMAELESRGWNLGGEASGHIVCLDKATTGDAIVAALQVLAAMLDSKLSLAELSHGMTKLPQVLVNVKFEKGTAPLENLHVKEVIAQVEQDLAGQGRVLIRKSGTEPLIRVMVEGREQQQVQNFAEKIAAAVKIAS